MTIYSGMFMSVNGDRTYKAWWFAKYFSSFIGNGVFPNPSTGLQVFENDNMTTVVKLGDGWIDGHYLHSNSDHVLQHDIADGVLKRIDRVVMRLNYMTRQIEIEIKKGAFASNPVAPMLKRDADMHELGLADVLINNGATQITQANITDLRLNSELCGIVHGVLDQVDTTTIFNQYQAWFNSITAGTEAEIKDWQIATKQEFMTWFQSIQGILDGDVAANLAARILDLEQIIDTHFEEWNAKATPEDVRVGIEQTTYSVTKLLPDAEGTFTVIEYRRKSDGTLAAKSTLSGGVAPQYTTRTIEYYDVSGLLVEKTEVFTLSYNSDGILIGEV